MGKVIATTTRPDRAEAFEHRIERFDHRPQRGTRRQSQCHGVECRFHVEPVFERAATHPQHAVALVVRKHRRARGQEYEFRAGGDACDVQALPAPVDDCGDRPPGMQPMRGREPLAHQHFVLGVGLEVSAADDVHIVQPRTVLVRHRHHQRARRLGKAFDFERDRGDEPVLGDRYAGQGLDSWQQLARGTFRAGEDVSKAIVTVVAVARIAQRFIAAGHRHEGGDAAHRDQRDGAQVPAHAPRVAQQLAVEHIHAFTADLTIRDRPAPRARRCARCC